MSEQRRDNLIYGRNAVLEALSGGRSVQRLYIQDGSRGSVSKILTLAKNKGVPVDHTSKARLDSLTGCSSHQGVACQVSEYSYANINEVIEDAGEQGLLIILDGIEDPHNVGAIMRTAECAGADGVIIPNRRNCGLTDTVAKVSAGAIEHIPCARVSNISNTIDLLKDNGYWICGTDMKGDTFWTCDLTGKIAIVIGSEGKGISRLVKEKCDFVASIPLLGKIESLNASNAAAILLYEAVKQRS